MIKSNTKRDYKTFDQNNIKGNGRNCLDYIYLVPVSVAILIPLNIIITYIWSSHINEDTIKYLPYISDTYDNPPQAVFYTQMFSVISVLMTFTCIFRWLQIDTILKSPSSLDVDFNQAKIVNKVGLIVGLLLCISTLLLSSARKSEVTTYHFILVVVVFLSAPVMYVLQTWLSFKMRPTMSSSLVTHTRLLTAVISIICVIVFTMGTYLAHSSKGKVCQDRWRLISAHAEYGFAVMGSPFALTFVSEFRRFKSVKGLEFIYLCDDVTHTQKESNPLIIPRL